MKGGRTRRLLRPASQPVHDCWRAPHRPDPRAPSAYVRLADGSLLPWAAVLQADVRPGAPGVRLHLHDGRVVWAAEK